MAKIAPKEIVEPFRLGRWCCRIPRVDDAKNATASNRGSSRPFDVRPTTCAEDGQQAQFRELQCLQAEPCGNGPPDRATALQENLPDNARAAIAQETGRAAETAPLHITAEEVEGGNSPGTGPGIATANPVIDCPDRIAPMQAHFRFDDDPDRIEALHADFRSGGSSPERGQTSREEPFPAQELAREKVWRA